jgi:hypothetical protein
MCSVSLRFFGLRVISKRDPMVAPWAKRQVGVTGGESSRTIFLEDK